MKNTAFSKLDDSSSCLNDAEKLRDKMSRDGYLFFRNFIDEKKVDKVRNDVIKILKEKGYLDIESPETTWSGKKSEKGDFDGAGVIGIQISKLNSIRKLYTSGEIVKLLKTFLGGEIHSWAENSGRVRCLLPSETNPAHQDQFFFRTSEKKEIPFYTAWTPLMDIDKNLGGLAILKASHKTGFLRHFYLLGKELGIPSSQNELQDWIDSGAYDVMGNVDKVCSEEWLRTDYKVGDLLLIHRLMVHRGLINNSDRIRISADFRYQRKGTAMSWRARHKFEYAKLHYARVRNILDEQGLKGEMADKIWLQLALVEGPSRSNRNTLLHRVNELTKTIDLN